MKITTIYKKYKTIADKMFFEIHPAFWLIFLFCFLFGGLRDLVFISLLALVHECGHAAVAARFGYHLKKIRLLPFGAELSGDDYFVPSHEIKIALAGPFVNFFVCVFCVCFMWLFPSWYAILKKVFEMSLVLFLFNLLPFFPLDGGRIFVAIVSKRIERKKALFVAKIFTFCFGILLFGLFVASIFFKINLSFGIMGLALIFCSVFPGKNERYERFCAKNGKQKKLRSGLLQKNIAILGSSTIFEALLRVEARSFLVFSVLDDNQKVMFCVTETELENYATKFGFDKKICEVVTKNIDK